MKAPGKLPEKSFKYRTIPQRYSDAILALDDIYFLALKRSANGSQDDEQLKAVILVCQQFQDLP